MTVSNRTYGVEIECILPVGTNQIAVAAALTARGIPCHFVSYGSAHRVERTWKITTDGSLTNSTIDYSRAAEIVSPVLKGDEGFAQIALVMDTLQDLGVTINKDCGFHVHVGVDDDLRLYKEMAKLYGAYEQVIDSIMPRSRRGNGNTWCHSIAHASREQIDATHSLRHLCQLLQPTRGREERYVKLNMSTRYTRGYPTIEFRQHSGTLQPEKALPWVKTCLRMVDKAASGVEFNRPAPVLPQAPKVRRGSKRAICVDMLLRPEGATREQLLAATGWPTISVQDVVSRTGMELITTRMGRRITYRLNQAVAQAHSLSAAASPMVFSLDGLCDLIGSANDERDYLNRRAANLASAHQWAA